MYNKIMIPTTRDLSTRRNNNILSEGSRLDGLQWGGGGGT